MLTWFKFNPTDWMMGKIQRCSEVYQARFLRLCCLYWKDECNLTVEDAKIEIEDDCYHDLLRRKIIKESCDYVQIDFLDMYLEEISEGKDVQSKKGKIGNLKRWYPSIYEDYRANKISLDDALEAANKSLPDRYPIATRSLNIADKTRQEEIRQDKTRQEEIILYPSFSDFWELYDKKNDKQKAESKWNKLTQKEKEAVMDYIPNYILTTPEKNYRRNPVTFLNNRTWENELIVPPKVLKDFKDKQKSELMKELNNNELYKNF